MPDKLSQSKDQLQVKVVDHAVSEVLQFCYASQPQKAFQTSLMQPVKESLTHCVQFW